MVNRVIGHTIRMDCSGSIKYNEDSMMTTMTIASLLLAVLYMGVAIWRKRELPETVSDMVWWLRKDRQWIWSAWLAAVSALLFVPLVDRCGAVGWLTEVCLMGSALTPLVNTETRVCHKWLGIAAGILSQVCVAMIESQWLTVWMGCVFILGSVYVQPEGRMAKAVMHKGVFVAEVCCMVSLFGCLIVNCVKLWIQQ